MSDLSNSSNEAYHANRSHLSSSTLKMLLKNPEEFRAHWFDGVSTKIESSALVEGSYTHSLILEPQKIAQEYAVYQGLRRFGAKYDEFVKENKEKSILTFAQESRAKSYFEAYKARVEAVRMMQGGKPEHTMISSFLGVPVKARADYINLEQGYIVDIKTTSYPAGPEMFKETIKQYNYDLSAALYCQIANNLYGSLFDFYFVVISKNDLVCDIYKASSETLSEGAGQMIKALVLYKKCLESGVWTKNQVKQNYDSKDYEILEV